MSSGYLVCPNCGNNVKEFRNPLPTVDIIIECENGGIVLIERLNEPFGWALPGGFVDYGESLENAALREAMEETSLHVEGLRLMGCYSDPSRDPRRHTITTVFIGKGKGIPIACDDAKNLAVFSTDNLPSELCFDHAKIVADYVKLKSTS